MMTMMSVPIFVATMSVSMPMSVPMFVPIFVATMFVPIFVAIMVSPTSSNIFHTRFCWWDLRRNLRRSLNFGSLCIV